MLDFGNSREGVVKGSVLNIDTIDFSSSHFGFRLVEAHEVGHDVTESTEDDAVSVASVVSVASCSKVPALLDHAEPGSIAPVLDRCSGWGRHLVSDFASVPGVFSNGPDSICSRGFLENQGSGPKRWSSGAEARPV